MTRSQSRSLPLPRLIVDSSPVQASPSPRKSTTQFAKFSASVLAHRSHPPPRPTYVLASSSIKSQRSVPFLADHVVSLLSLSTCPFLTHPFPSHAKHHGSTGRTAEDRFFVRKTAPEDVAGEHVWKEVMVEMWKVLGNSLTSVVRKRIWAYGLTPSPSNPALRIGLSHPQRHC